MLMGRGGEGPATISSAGGACWTPSPDVLCGLQRGYGVLVSSISPLNPAIWGKLAGMPDELEASSAGARMALTLPGGCPLDAASACSSLLVLLSAHP